MRNKDDLPYAQTVLAIGEGKIKPVLLKDGSAAYLSSTLLPTTMVLRPHVPQMVLTEFQDLIDIVLPRPPTN